MKLIAIIKEVENDVAGKSGIQLCHGLLDLYLQLIR